MKDHPTIKKNNHHSILMVSLFLGLNVMFFINLSLGSVTIPLSEIIDYLLNGSTSKTSWTLILSSFRLPKAFTSLLVGGALGLAGLQMQTLFRNPLAGPYVLGISSGAGLGVAIAIFAGITVGSMVDMSGLGRSWLLVVSGAMGAGVVLMIVLIAARRLQESTSLLIVGLMFGTASGAVVSILQFFSKAENIQAYVFWSFGSLGNLSWEELYIFVPIILVAMTGSILISKPLNALLLGENYARSLGINIQRTRWLIILHTTLLAGTVTSFCGPIGFFGIAMPHIARMIFNTTNHLILSPVIILAGGILMLIFDTLAQLPGLEATLPINAITAILGAPFVIYLILRRRSLNYSYQG
jgi:iron complex transport system permease protein